MSVFKNLLCFCLFVLLTSCGPDLPDGVEVAMAKVPEVVDYNIHVRPIFSDRCYACHGPDAGNIKGGLQLHSPEAAYKESIEHPGTFPIVPGKLASSEVFHRLVSDDPNIMMPPPESNLKLSDYERAVLIKWIDQGAEYKDHWAFIKPEMPKVPTVKDESFVVNSIDNFVGKRLEREGLTTNDPADKSLLLRRVTFDLTGLPPTPAEIDAFLADEDENAYEKVVDRLLASPRYGEHMAVDWLDLARYADTHGDQKLQRKLALQQLRNLATGWRLTARPHPRANLGYRLQPQPPAKYGGWHCRGGVSRRIRQRPYQHLWYRLPGPDDGLR